MRSPLPHTPQGFTRGARLTSTTSRGGGRAHTWSTSPQLAPAGRPASTSCGRGTCGRRARTRWRRQQRSTRSEQLSKRHMYVYTYTRSTTHRRGRGRRRERRGAHVASGSTGGSQSALPGPPARGRAATGEGALAEASPAESTLIAPGGKADVDVAVLFRGKGWVRSYRYSGGSSEISNKWIASQKVGAGKARGRGRGGSSGGAASQSQSEAEAAAPRSGSGSGSGRAAS